MQKFHSKHPDPNGAYWTIRINTDLPQKVEKVKEITTSAAMGVRRKGYILFNPSGDMIGIQVYQEPSLEIPGGEKDEKGSHTFNVNFKMPDELGLFPPYKVLVSLLKRRDDADS